MTRTWLKVLMAASALVPVAATAQRGPDAQLEGRGQWGQRGDRGGRGDGGARADRPQSQPAAQQQAPQQQAPQQAQQTQQRYGQYGRQGQRDDRQNGGQPNRFAGRDNEQGRPNVQGGRQDYRNGQNYQGQRYQGQRYQGQGARPNYQGGQYRGGYDNRQAYNNGGNWNRGWRSDNRYAWSNYRASNRGAYRLPRYYAPGGWSGGYRRFGVGFALSDILYDQSYWIQDPYTYRLPEAYGPYQWVRYYNDALLVDLDSGRVVDTVYDIFW
jgi:hypothetical protein